MLLPNPDVQQHPKGSEKMPQVLGKGSHIEQR